MYIRARLKNWRSVEDATIELAPFTVIVGRNSSGKSNIVDALLFSSEMSRDASTAVSRRGGIGSIRRWGPSKPYDVTLDVRVSETREHLDSHYTRHELVLRSGKDGAWYFLHENIEQVSDGKMALHVHRDRTSVKRVVGEVRPGTLQEIAIDAATSAMLVARQFWLGSSRSLRHPMLSQTRAIRPVPELMRQPQPPTEAWRLSENGSNITSALHKMPEAARSEVVSAMRRIIPGLRDVRSQAAGRYLTLAFTQAYDDVRAPEFAATEMSDGALRALAVVVAAQQMARGELLVIEEPEVNLHPGAADVVYDVLHRASKRGAVLVTTHSPELLDRAKEDEILVCEFAGGVTRIGPLAMAQRELVREGVFSTAELMRSEELRREGAPPRVIRDDS